MFPGSHFNEAVSSQIRTKPGKSEKLPKLIFLFPLIIGELKPTLNGCSLSSDGCEVENLNVKDGWWCKARP